MTELSAWKEFQSWLATLPPASAELKTIVPPLETAAAPSSLLQWHAGGEGWFDVEASPADDWLQVGFKTGKRYLNEEIESNVLHKFDSLEEMLEEGLNDLDLEGPYPVDHYREIVFCYTTKFEGVSPKLSSPGLRQQVHDLLRGYVQAFSAFLPKK